MKLQKASIRTYRSIDEMDGFQSTLRSLVWLVRMNQGKLLFYKP